MDETGPNIEFNLQALAGKLEELDLDEVSSYVRNNIASLHEEKRRLFLQINAIFTTFNNMRNLKLESNERK